MQQLPPIHLTNQYNEEIEPINLDDYILQNEIGKGSYSKVYLAKEKKTGDICAAKVLKSEIDSFDDDSINISREINIHAKLNHPSILRFIGYSLTDFKKRPRLVILAEHATGGSLKQFIKSQRDSNSNIIDTTKLIIIYGIASAMSYLHSHKIIHRDLSPNNILIDNFIPKISDFGLSKIKHSNLNSMSIGSIDALKGTPIYIAPEIYREYDYNYPGDVYAFSIIVFELLTNQVPFEEINYLQFLSEIAKGYRPEFKTSIPESYKKLIISCWNDDPSLRPTFDQIVDMLKNDKSFITKDINENEFRNFVNFIDEYNATSKKIDIYKKRIFNSLTKQNNILDSNQIIDYLSVNDITSPYEDYIQLNENCKKIVKDAVNDPEKQFLIGKYLIEGYDLFQRNVFIGIKYLKKSLKNGFFESAVYYCRLLIKGNIIPCNIQKAKKILENIIKDKDQGLYLLLHGKICKKENNIDESRIFFEKSISYNNNESMYEYGKLLFKEKFNISNKEKGIFYFQQAINNGCLKAMFKYGQILLKGIEIQKNEALGIQYIKISAEQDYPDALFYYSQMLEKGELIPKDENLYFKCLQKAAYKGQIDAMYYYGMELPRKQLKLNQEILKESFLFLKKSSDAGNFQSMFEYSHFIINGKVAKSDPKKEL